MPSLRDSGLQNQCHSVCTEPAPVRNWRSKVSRDDREPRLQLVTMAPADLRAHVPAATAITAAMPRGMVPRLFVRGEREWPQWEWFLEQVDFESRVDLFFFIKLNKNKF